MSAKLGILAGGGDLPARLVAACRRQGREVFVLAFTGQADPAAVADVPHAWIRLGEAGRGFKILKEQNCAEVVMAGPVRRPSLGELRPDWRTLAFFSRIGVKALGDDGLLRAVISELEAEGLTVIGAHEVLADLLAEPGLWGRHSPDEQAKADMARGLAVGHGLGALDVGQSVVVQQGIVLGVEAVEGTDALIDRCAGLRREGPGGVLVKICKPGQERRADLPTIGPRTVEACAAAGLRGIAVEAGAALVLNRAEVVAAADRLGLFLYGLAPFGQDACA
ncbi:hypothetical protein GALL_271860 [mine drainage metagenome]|uniref:UDP-2,3-diacylglucosamine pyrophosphatase LpxI n=1 Tax=mine drainage metagenome TaxID=410659 RepID=A0A1J5R4L7_9ZZZZ